MTTLEQLVYLADKIEPNRCYPGVDELRRLARTDFRQALTQASAILCAICWRNVRQFIRRRLLLELVSKLVRGC